MFNVVVKTFKERDEISLICKEFEKYNSIKYIKFNNFNGVISNWFKDYYDVYYDKNEYIAECLIHGNIMSRIKKINELDIIYKTIEEDI